MGRSSLQRGGWMRHQSKHQKQANQRLQKGGQHIKLPRANLSALAQMFDQLYCSCYVCTVINLHIVSVVNSLLSCMTVQMRYLIDCGPLYSSARCARLLSMTIAR